MGDLQGFVPSFVVASACGLVSGFLAVFSLFRGCVAVFTTTWPGFVDFLLVKFLITDRETVLLVTNSEFQSLICILALYHRPMSSTSAVASNCVCWTTTSTLHPCDCVPAPGPTVFSGQHAHVSVFAQPGHNCRRPWAPGLSSPPSPHG